MPPLAFLKLHFKTLLKEMRSSRALCTSATVAGVGTGGSPGAQLLCSWCGLHQPTHMVHSSLASFAPGLIGTPSFKSPFTTASVKFALLWTAQLREQWDPAICETGHKQVFFH